MSNNFSNCLEKYKSQLSRAKSASKETADSEKRKVEQLTAENKRLEKQKQELMTGWFNYRNFENKRSF